MAKKESGTWTYYTFDQQGNVVQKLNSSGGVTATRTYDAYGAETGTSASGADPFGYNAQWGYYLDRDTGMYLCQHRWYDPYTGRWLTRDPIGYAGEVNLYGYCGGRPVEATDEEGLQRSAVQRSKV